MMIKLCLKDSKCLFEISILYSGISVKKTICNKTASQCFFISSDELFILLFCFPWSIYWTLLAIHCKLIKILFAFNQTSCIEHSIIYSYIDFRISILFWNIVFKIYLFYSPNTICKYFQKHNFTIKFLIRWLVWSFIKWTMQII